MLAYDRTLLEILITSTVFVLGVGRVCLLSSHDHENEPRLELFDGGIRYHYRHGATADLKFDDVRRFRVSGESDDQMRLEFQMRNGEQLEIRAYEQMSLIRRHCEEGIHKEEQT